MLDVCQDECPFACPQRSIRFADAILNGTSCPFYKGGLFPSPFLPEIERWGVSLSAESDEGTRTLRYEFAGKLTSTCELLKKLDQNFNPVRAGCVCGDLLRVSASSAGHNAGSSNL